MKKRHNLNPIAFTLLLLFCGVGVRASAPLRGMVEDDVAAAEAQWRIDWDEMAVDSGLPVYREVVPLETDPRSHTYTACVRYPEWEPMSGTEMQALQPYLALLSDTLRLDLHAGMSRGEGMLDVSFVPVVRQGGKLMKLTGGVMEITATPLQGRSRAPHRAKSTQPASSRLATGTWARVTLTADGIYFLTHSALRALGFKDPTHIRVYGHGGHLLPEVVEDATTWRDLEEVALLPVEGGFLFHANGLMTWREGRHVQNHYARSASYFITEDSTQPTPIASLNASATSSRTEASTFTAHTVHDPQEYAWFQGGRKLYENDDYATGGARQYTLTLPAYVAAGSTATLTVDFTAANATPTTVNTAFNGTTLETFNIAAQPDEYTYAVHGHKSFIVEAPKPSNIVRLQSTAGSHARLNYLELTFTGSLRIDAAHPMLSFAHMVSEESEVLTLEYASGQQPQLWRLAEPGIPAVRLEGTAQTVQGADGKSHNLLHVALEGDDTEHRYVFFDAAASWPEPANGGAVANQNLHGLDSIDMVIITPSCGLFDAEAERLAQAHRDLDGLRTVVVRADQVYNEFSSGTPDATAYRLFMKMLYDKAASMDVAPRYLLLFGDCAWDNRMLSAAWRGYDPTLFLLCFESENSVSDTRCFVMEDYFGLLDDGEGGDLTSDKVDIGVGRFPVRTVTEAKQLVDKTIAYMQGAQVGAWKNVVVFLGDDGDNNEHMRYADDVAERVEKANPELEVRKVMWDIFPRVSTASGNRYPQVTQTIQRQMDEGALMVNYTGHGAYYCLSHEMVFRLDDFNNYSSPRVPVWVTAACDVMPFDTQKDNIGETAILNPSGAAIAFFGTARTVYAYNNLQMNRQFCHYAFGKDDNGEPYRLGDAVRLAKVTLITEGLEMGNAENKLHYALLGDPALRLGNQANRVVVDSINGTALEELPVDFTLHAGGKARLAGHVEGPEGATMSQFNGALSVHLYDSKNKLTCLNQAGATSAFSFQAYDKMLYSGRDSVRQGRFTMTCPIPTDINYSNEAGRMVFYAVSTDRSLEANGYSEDFKLGGTEPQLNDTTGPRITAWLGEEDFTNGDVVGATPYFVATVEDESGISTAGSSVGHDMELVIDGLSTTTYSLNDYFVNDFGNYSRGTVAFSIPTLEAGEHTLLFRAWDMLGNPGQTELTFTVDPTKKPSILSIAAAPSPAMTETTFLLSYNRPGSLCTFTLEVFDFTGRQLWTHTEQSSSQTGLYSVTWNLTTGGSFPLGSGVYLYRARVRCDDSEEVSATKKLIINRRKSS